MLIGILFGWLLPKMSALSVFSSRLAGVVIMAFVAPAICSVNSGLPYAAAPIPYGIAALIAAVFFYFLKSRQQAA
ncbi:MAG: hypothetical protein HOQ41_07195 [Ensifer adhaerens]|nr:hypothetical protein [Ensifer adhaerens]